MSKQARVFHNFVQLIGILAVLVLLPTGPLYSEEVNAVEVTVLSIEDDRPKKVPDWEEEETGLEIERPGLSLSESFRIVVTERRLIMIETIGLNDTFGLLLDEAGMDVAGDDDSGVGRNFKMEVLLEPGSYYLGVTFRGPTGPYILRMTSLPPLE